MRVKKICFCCSEEKANEAFYFSSVVCKECNRKFEQQERKVAREKQRKAPVEMKVRRKKMLRKEINRQYYTNNRTSIRTKEHSRRAQKQGNGGKFTVPEWNALLVYFGFRCACCRRVGLELCADHIRPIKFGGSSWAKNIQPLCFSCNNIKSSKVTFDCRAIRQQWKLAKEYDLRETLRDMIRVAHVQTG